MNGFKVEVKEGYRLIALVPQDGIYHAIIDRQGSCDRYVYCWSYDINDGTWGQGYYFGDYRNALKEMAHHILGK